MQTVKVDADFEFIVLSAMRYAIGRRSYAVHLIADYIKEVWEKLSDNCKALLSRDLQHEISQADRGIESKIYKFDPLGDSCDRETWINLNTWMKERIIK